MAMMMPDVSRGTPKPDRTYLRVAHLDDLLEFFGAIAICVAVGALVGFVWALLLAGVLAVVAANLVMSDGASYRIPLPRRRHRHLNFRIPRPHIDLARRRASLTIDFRLLRKGIWPW